MDFAEYLRKSNVSDNSKVYYGRFYEMDFIKGTVIFVKVDEMILLTTGYWPRDEGEIG